MLTHETRLPLFVGYPSYPRRLILRDPHTHMSLKPVLWGAEWRPCMRLDGMAWGRDRQACRSNPLNWFVHGTLFANAPRF